MMQKLLPQYWGSLISLLVGIGLLNGVLEIQSASVGMRIAVKAMLLYLAWSGWGAIAPVTFGITLVMWIETLFTPAPSEEFSALFHLTPAQVWSISLGLGLLLFLGLAVKLASFSSRLQSSGIQKVPAFLLLAIVITAGVNLGHLIKAYFPPV
jgi:hypothetical protein